MRLYLGCALRISTSTTMVFCILVETTCPTFSLRRDAGFVPAAVLPVLFSVALISLTLLHAARPRSLLLDRRRLSRRLPRRRRASARLVRGRALFRGLLLRCLRYFLLRLLRRCAALNLVGMRMMLRRHQGVDAQ